jgi:hypothetical protein
MCTELFLAMIYFLTIAIINFFLYKLLKNYSKNILSQQKIKKIFYICDCKNNIFSYLYNYIDQENKKTEILQKLSLSCNTKDFLIIGNTYKILAQYSKKNLFFDSLYFKLLENQYLKSV